jgi:hypothetical protein
MRLICPGQTVMSRDIITISKRMTMGIEVRSISLLVFAVASPSMKIISI